MEKSGLSILLADNEPLVRLGISMMLREAGMSCSAADGASEAIHMLDGGMQPDLLIADYNMPGKTGVELGLDIQQRLPAIKILIVSGDEQVGDEMPDDWQLLVKPFTAGELFDQISLIFPCLNAPVKTS